MESKDLVADIKKATGGKGPHAAIVTASGAKAYEQALEVSSSTRFFSPRCQS